MFLFIVAYIKTYVLIIFLTKYEKSLIQKFEYEVLMKELIIIK